jgi:integrase
VARDRRRQRKLQAAASDGFSPSAVPPEASRIFQKNGRWWHIDLRKRGSGRPVLRDPSDPVSGRRTTDKATAEEWAREYDRRWHKDQDEKHAKRTGTHRRLETAAEAFLKHRRARCAPSTAAGSRTALGHLLEEFGPEISPSVITSDELQLLLDEFLEAGYEPNTVRGMRAHLQVFFDHIKVAPNPAEQVKLPKETAPNAIAWGEDDRTKLREAADALDVVSENDSRFYRRLTEFMLATGLRIQEVAAAAHENIDEGTKTLRVARQISRSTNKAIRTKGLEARSTTILPEWWEFHYAEGTGLLFPAANGGPIPYRKLYDHVVAVLMTAGLKKPGQAAHQFRHTYSFLFLDHGGTLDELSKCLGHKSVKVTQKYYDHFTSDHAAKSAASRFYGEGTRKRGPRKKQR